MVYGGVDYVVAVSAIGLIAGTISGLLGVTPGGILVPGLALVSGGDQHQAQAVSLVAQLLPTSLAGSRVYRHAGHAAPGRSVLLVASGFLPGAYLGARGALLLSDRILRWAFVAISSSWPSRSQPKNPRRTTSPQLLLRVPGQALSHSRLSVWPREPLQVCSESAAALQSLRCFRLFSPCHSTRRKRSAWWWARFRCRFLPWWSMSPVRPARRGSRARLSFAACLLAPWSVHESPLGSTPMLCDDTLYCSSSSWRHL